MFLDKSKRDSSESEEIELEDLSEERIKEIVRCLAWPNCARQEYFSHNELIYEIIYLIGCDLNHAQGIVTAMKRLGLGVCLRDCWEASELAIRYSLPQDNLVPKYNLWVFGRMRGYISQEELSQYWDKLAKQKQRREELEEKFYEKYGDDEEKWPEKIWDEYEELDFSE